MAKKELENKPGLSPEELEARAYIVDDSAWTAAGEEFGGKSDILIIQVGEIAGPFNYVGHQQMTTELGETTVHLATLKDETMRLPIQATFIRAVDQAGLKRGDTFLIKRFEDQEKKRGKGAGNQMAIYGVKVLKRAAMPF
jgi:hypothetical protein